MYKKKCGHCGLLLDINLFYKNKYKQDGLKYCCKKCHNITAHNSRVVHYSKEQRKKQYNKEIRNPKSYLSSIYRHMKNRVDGKNYIKTTAEGQKILDKKTFIEWSIDNSRFNKLFYYYINNGRHRKYAPSIDRINVKIGYILSNMQWLTVSDNSIKGNTIDRLNKLIKNKL